MSPKIHAPCPQCGYPGNNDSEACANCGFSFKDLTGAVEKGQINTESIMAIIGSQPVDIRDIITKLGVTDMSVARNLQMLLKKLENSGKIKAYVEKGRKLYLK